MNEQEHDTTGAGRAQHFPRLAHSLKAQVCEACGAYISAGTRFLYFDWFPGREHSIACTACGTARTSEVAA